jgi:hypothetical protein
MCAKANRKTRALNCIRNFRSSNLEELINLKIILLDRILGNTLKCRFIAILNEATLAFQNFKVETSVDL